MSNSLFPLPRDIVQSSWLASEARKKEGKGGSRKKSEFQIIPLRKGGRKEKKWGFEEAPLHEDDDASDFDKKKGGKGRKIEANQFLEGLLLLLLVLAKATYCHLKIMSF